MSVGLEVNCCSRSERWLGACAVRGDSAFVRRGANGCLSGERWPGGLPGGRWLCVLLGGEVARCLFGERWLGVCGVRGDLVFVRRDVNGCLSGERWPGGLSGGRWLCVLLGGKVARCFLGER